MFDGSMRHLTSALLHNSILSHLASTLTSGFGKITLSFKNYLLT
jgi:hypothetical protein